MSDSKVCTKKKGVRLDKQSGRLKECLYDEAEFLIDERGYSATDFLNEGVRSLSAREGKMQRETTEVIVQDAKVVPLELRVGGAAPITGNS